MQRTAMGSSGLSDGRPSLRDAISGLHLEFAQMRDDLRQAHREIGALKRELRSRPTKAIPPMPDSNLGSLRRMVSFYCHPDRGGDERLMRRLNVLFDFLVHLQGSKRPAPALEA